MKQRFKPDRGYCPECEKSKYSFEQTEDGECEECGTGVSDEWPDLFYTRWLAKRLAVYTIGSALLFGPFVAGVATILGSSRPLIVTKRTTITTTELGGSLPEAAPLFIFGILIWVVAIGMAIGPRRM